jgi:hypothetical protein
VASYALTHHPQRHRSAGTALAVRKGSGTLDEGSGPAHHPEPVHQCLRRESAELCQELVRNDPSRRGAGTSGRQMAAAAAADARRPTTQRAQTARPRHRAWARDVRCGARDMIAEEPHA